MAEQEVLSEKVDICFTCVSKEPPKLPLREEVESLGVELVYNSKGVGRRAVRRESKNLAAYLAEEESKSKKKNNASKKKERISRTKKLLRRVRKSKSPEKDGTKQKQSRKSVTYDNYHSALLRAPGSSADDTSTQSSATGNTVLTNGTSFVESPTRSKDRALNFNDDAASSLMFPEKDGASPLSLALDNMARQHNNNNSSSAASVDSLTSGRNVADDLALPSIPTPSSSTLVANNISPRAKQINTTASSPSSISSASNSQRRSRRISLQHDAKEANNNHNNNKNTLTSNNSPKGRHWYENYDENVNNDAEEDYTYSFDSPNQKNSLQESSDDEDEQEDANSGINTAHTPTSQIARNTPQKENGPSPTAVAEFPYSPTSSTAQDSYYQSSQHQSDQPDCATAMFDMCNLSNIFTNQDAEEADPFSPMNSPPTSPTMEDEDLRKLQKRQLLQQSRRASSQAINNNNHNTRQLIISPTSSCDASYNAGLMIPSPPTSPTQSQLMGENALFCIISQVYALPDDVKSILDTNPHLVRQMCKATQRYPIHACCDRNFPDRSGGNNRTLPPSFALENSNNHHQVASIHFGELVKDIIHRRVLTKVVAWSFVDACVMPDINGDLPVHILARRLLEWRRSWELRPSLLQRQKRKNQPNEQGIDDDDDESTELDEREEYFNSEYASSMARVTTLYRTMAQCIEVVLQPIAASTRTLCRAPGNASRGTLIPLHIAAIFGSSYHSLKLLLEEYPEGAGVRCLCFSGNDSLLPFWGDHNKEENGVDEGMLPLELMERTRQQREDIQNGNNGFDTKMKNKEKEKGRDVHHGGIRWSNSTLDTSNVSDDFYRRSDLIFAFNPNILPYRKEPARLRRIESLIRSGAKEVDKREGSPVPLSAAVISVWTWMCTFRNPHDKTDNYANSVENVVAPLDIDSLMKLLAVKVSTDHSDGVDLLNVATPQCALVIESKLERVMQERKERAAKEKQKGPMPILDIVQKHKARQQQQQHQHQPSSTRQITKEEVLKQEHKQGATRSLSPELQSQQPREQQQYKSILKKGSRVTTMNRNPVNPRQDIGRLLKALFNIHEEAIPTSFVILPYKLCRADSNSQVTLESGSDAQIAIQFAELLLRLTSADDISRVLDMKFKGMHNAKGTHKSHNDGSRNYIKGEEATDDGHHEDVQSFLSLYKSNVGYLYLLDDCTGTPIVGASSKNAEEHSEESIYPITVHNVSLILEKIFPLMIMGMTLMRGDKALKVLSHVLSLGKVQNYPSSWLGAAQDVISYIYSQGSSPAAAELEPIREHLLEFVSEATSPASPRSSSTSSQNVRGITSPYKDMDEDGSEWAVEVSFLKILFEKFDARRTYGGLKPFLSRGSLTIWSSAEQMVVAEEECAKEEQSNEEESHPPAVVSRGLDLSSAYQENSIDEDRTKTTEVTEESDPPAVISRGLDLSSAHQEHRVEFDECIDEDRTKITEVTESTEGEVDSILNTYFSCAQTHCSEVSSLSSYVTAAAESSACGSKVENNGEIAPLLPAVEEEAGKRDMLQQQNEHDIKQPQDTELGTSSSADVGYKSQSLDLSDPLKVDVPSSNLVSSNWSLESSVLSQDLSSSNARRLPSASLKTDVPSSDAGNKTRSLDLTIPEVSIGHATDPSKVDVSVSNIDPGAWSQDSSVLSEELSRNDASSLPKASLKTNVPSSDARNKNRSLDLTIPEMSSSHDADPLSSSNIDPGTWSQDSSVLSEELSRNNASSLPKTSLKTRVPTSNIIRTSQSQDSSESSGVAEDLNHQDSEQHQNKHMSPKGVASLFDVDNNRQSQNLPIVSEAIGELSDQGEKQPQGALSDLSPKDDDSQSNNVDDCLSLNPSGSSEDMDGWSNPGTDDNHSNEQQKDVVPPMGTATNTMPLLADAAVPRDQSINTTDVINLVKDGVSPSDVDQSVGNQIKEQQKDAVPSLDTNTQKISLLDDTAVPRDQAFSNNGIAGPSKDGVFPSDVGQSNHSVNSSILSEAFEELSNHDFSSSDVSSLTCSQMTKDMAPREQSDDHGIPDIIQTLSAVVEEDQVESVGDDSTQLHQEQPLTRDISALSCNNVNEYGTEAGPTNVIPSSQDSLAFSETTASEMVDDIVPHANQNASNYAGVHLPSSVADMNMTGYSNSGVYGTDSFVSTLPQLPTQENPTSTNRAITPWESDPEVVGAYSSPTIVTDCDTENGQSKLAGLSLCNSDQYTANYEKSFYADELNKRDILLKEKDEQIKKLQEALLAFDQEEMDLMNEKDKLIQYLADELNLYEDERLREDEGKASSDEYVESLQKALSQSSEDVEHLQRKDEMNEELSTSLMSKIYELEQQILSKEIEIEQLKLGLQATEIKIVQEKDEEIEELRRTLRIRDEEIYEISKTLEEYIVDPFVDYSSDDSSKEE